MRIATFPLFTCIILALAGWNQGRSYPYHAISYGGISNTSFFFKRWSFCPAGWRAHKLQTEYNLDQRGDREMLGLRIRCKLPGWPSDLYVNTVEDYLPPSRKYSNRFWTEWRRCGRLKYFKSFTLKKNTKNPEKGLDEVKMGCELLQRWGKAWSKLLPQQTSPNQSPWKTSKKCPGKTFVCGFQMIRSVVSRQEGGRVMGLDIDCCKEGQ